MARIELAPEVLHDLDRIIDHLLQHEAKDAPARVQEIIRAIDVLEHNPLIGRGIDSGSRELIIGRDARGYVALYRYIPEMDTVLVLALRSQHEAGYARP